MASGTLTIQGSINGLPFGNESFGAGSIITYAAGQGAPFVISLPSALGEVYPDSLVEGDNPIPVNPAANLIWVILPKTNIYAVTVRDKEGDSGVNILPAGGVFLYQIDPLNVPANLYIHAANAIPGVEILQL